MHNAFPLARARAVAVPLAICAVLAALALYECTFHAVGLDQGGWSYEGWAWEAHGAAPYSGTMDNKTPGIMMLYAIFVRYFGITIWPHAVTATAALAGTALLLFALARRLHDETAAVFSMLLFALTTTLPSYNGVLYVEPMVALFSTAAFYLVLTLSGGEKPAGNGRLLLAGVSAGMAILFKQTAIFDALALCIISGKLALGRGGRMAEAARGIAIILAGLALATLAGLMPLLASGTTLRQYWEGGWLLLLKPGTAASLTNRIYTFVLVWAGIGLKMPLFYPLVLLFILLRTRLRQASVPWGCLLVWVALTFVGVNASGRLWGHQVQEILPVLTLIAGIGLSAAIQAVNAEKPQRRACIAWGLTAICVLWAPVELFDVTCQRIDRELKSEAPPPDNRKLLGLWLHAQIPSTDPVFVWTRDAGAIYAYAQRLAPSRYYNNHFGSNAEAMVEVQQAIERQPPQYVVLEKKPYPPIPHDLQQWIEDHYSPSEERFGYVILKRSTRE